jgi:hypothetical protein
MDVLNTVEKFGKIDLTIDVNVLILTIELEIDRHGS